MSYTFYQELTDEELIVKTEEKIKNLNNENVFKLDMEAKKLLTALVDRLKRKQIRHVKSAIFD